jgi:carotenoid 1,2-hydratase
VAAGGYVWWYVDALSEDGRFGLTLIAFIGSVFSPYYAMSGRRDPSDHCAINVALYGASGRRWAMTERRRTALRRDADTLAIGPSALTWDGDGLTVDFDELGAPLPQRLRGRVRLTPRALTRRRFDLDPAGRHSWRPIAPRAEVTVELDSPACAWRGEGYFDTNAGVEPLETAFVGWDWSRAHRRDDTLLFYDVARRDGGATNLALRIDRDGAMTPVDAPDALALKPTLWRLPRRLRADPDGLRDPGANLEDTPFYARAQLEGRVGGEAASIVHETLSLDRLRSPVVRAMLPFRMPRIFW